MQKTPFINITWTKCLLHIRGWCTHPHTHMADTHTHNRHTHTHTHTRQTVMIHLVIDGLSLTTRMTTTHWHGVSTLSRHSVSMLSTQHSQCKVWSYKAMECMLFLLHQVIGPGISFHFYQSLSVQNVWKITHGQLVVMEPRHTDTHTQTSSPTFDSTTPPPSASSTSTIHMYLN